MMGHGLTPFLCGNARYVEDGAKPDHLVMHVLRSPVARGDIVQLDLSEARDMPGVAAILTIEDLDRAGISLLPSRAPVTQVSGAAMTEAARPILARNRVTYLGEPVAAIFAKSHHQAEDAAEAILLDIDAATPVTDPRCARTSEAVHPDCPDNLAFEWEKGTRQACDAAFAKAAHIVTLDIAHPRIAMAPIETRGLIAEYDRVSGRFHLETPSQGVFSIRAAVADCLGISASDLRVTTRNVGGSFAVKIFAYPEHVLALCAARLTGQTIRWSASRSESMQADAIGRGRFDHGALALDANGKFLGFRVRAIADMGAYLNSVAPYVATGGAVRPFGQCYAIPAMHYRVQGIYTNAPPTDAYRGAGKPESAATLERLIDLAAARLGLDPFELRTRNLITPGDLPYQTAMGETYDGGDFPELADALLDASDWAGYPARQDSSRSKGVLRGRAVCFHLHATGGSTSEETVLTLEKDGKLHIRTGTQDSGQGHRQTLAMIAAKTLGIRPEEVEVSQGDTDELERGGGTGGSSQVAIAGSNVLRAAKRLIEQMTPLAADHLETATVDITYGNGAFQVVGTDRSVGLTELARAQEPDTPACAVAEDFEGLHTTFPNGGYVVEAEIDPDTGATRLDRFIGISDIGEVIDPAGALGQIQGGIAQGIGEALLEELQSDPDGQLLSGSLMDYTLPRADNIPDLVLSFRATGSPNSQTGAKGVGELPSIGTPGVVINAVLDALRPLGVTHIDKPVTPAKIWMAMKTGAKNGQ